MDEFAFVEARWLDAQSDANWVGLDSLPKVLTMISRGWLVQDEADHITLVASYATDAPTREVSEITTIPRPCVVSLTELQPKKSATIYDFETGLKSE